MRVSTAVAVAGMAVGVAATPRAASASCSAGAIVVCAAFDASTSFDGTNYHLVLKVWNLFDGTAANGLSSVITFAGIGNASWDGSVLDLVSATFGGSPVAGWSLANNINNNVVGGQVNFAGLTTGINEGLVGCGSATKSTQYSTCYPNGPELDLDFTTSKLFDLNGAVFGWHSQAINSTSCSLWANSNGQSTADNATDCSSVVPEPVTLSLLATGLAGIGGVGFIRRRRRGLEDDGRAV